MKRFIISLLIILLLLTLTTKSTATYSVPYCIDTYTIDDIDTLSELIDEQDVIMDAAHTMADAARTLGYSEGHSVILLAQKEYQEASESKAKYENIYNNLLAHWKQKEEEYPAASYIWKYFKDLGCSNEVTAGILGNIMAEVGGQTLNIQWWLSSNYYVGMCQWSRSLTNISYNPSLEEQCNYLRDTIEYEINTFGYAYKSNFNYEAFLSLTDAQDAALAFSKTYERCTSMSHY